nr:unknown [uncultured bacterium]
MAKAAEDLERVEGKIANYLEKNPEFFERHPQLLENLKINHKVYGSVSLVERQILNLRQRTESLQIRLNEMIDNAHVNSELLVKCSELAVNLIQVSTKQEVVDTLSKKIHDYFNIDDCQLWLCQNNDNLENVKVSDIDTLRKLTDQQFIQDDPVCGRVTESIGQLFDSETTLESYALIPLGEGAEVGIIALGSQNVELFTADMGTLFLRFIGDVAEACLTQ